MFFSSTAVESGPGTWTADVRGWIFERGRAAQGIELLAKMIRDRYGLGRDELRTPVFRQRAAMFVVDNERNKRLAIAMGGSSFTLAPSTSSGHVRDRMVVNVAVSTPGNWSTFRVLTGANDSRVFEGAVQFVRANGVSVVSDIDDTIKISQVLEARELAANTFVRAFRAVPGMASLYRQWAAEGDVVFHYVSGSPWQLYPFLADFAHRDGFPRGSFDLREFRLKDSSGVEFLENRTLDFKLGVIERLVRAFPGRQFVFVGDSGEKDPEVYSQIALRFPMQVSAIVIRDVTGESLGSARFAKLYEGLAPHIQRRIFQDPTELADFRLVANRGGE